MKLTRLFLLSLLVVLFAALPAQADIILPANTTIIEDQAFMNDASLIGTIVIPEGVTEIGVEAFYCCTGVTEVQMPENPIIIGSRAFADCPDLEGKIYLHEDSSVAEDAFDEEKVEVIIGLPEGYPEIVPEMIQEEHTTITVYDYWSGDGARKENPSAAEQDRYDYEDWIEQTYNVKIQQMAGGDWSTCAQEMINFKNAPDGSLRAYIIEPGKVGNLVKNGIAASWTGVNLSGSKWNKGVIDLWSAGGKHYAVSTGAHEPNVVIFFNKRLLEEASIDWNSIYDMQANRTWTWSAFESLLEKAHRDIDDDGVIDVWGLLGSRDELYKMAVFTNGAAFFEHDASGKLQPAMGSSTARAALNWACDIDRNYFMPQPQDASWDWYKTEWNNASAAFYVYPAYGGFNNYSEMSGMADEWGAVVFPLGPSGTKYGSVVSENATLIPSCYSNEEVKKIAFFYDLWTNNEVSSGWVGTKLNNTDRRAVYETYGMLRSPAHGYADKTVLLGSFSNILGSPLIWALPGTDPDALIDAGMAEWQALCDAYNQ